jgi:lipopolysaccharide transport protein LptA
MNTLRLKGWIRTAALAVAIGFVSSSCVTAQEPADPPPATAAKPKEVKVGNIKIASTKGANFNSKENTAEFIGDVVVVHPGFTMNSDRLMVYLAADQSGMDRAVATGYVTIRKAGDESGKNYYVGKARHATFKGKEQTVTLTDWPQIQQNNSLHIATARDTVMVLDQDGTLKTHGNSRTVLPDNEARGTQQPAQPSQSPSATAP